MQTYVVSGLDGVSPWVVKGVVDVIANLLSIIYTSFLKEGLIPDDWRHANIAPIFLSNSGVRAQWGLIAQAVSSALSAKLQSQ
jgi:hypothetical protein